MLPPEIVDRLVAAMVPLRVCVTCGEPSRRIVSTSYDPTDPSAWGGRAEWSTPRPTAAQQNEADTAKGNQGSYGGAQSMPLGRAARVDTTLGWTDCGHDNWRTGVALYVGVEP